MRFVDEAALRGVRAPGFGRGTAMVDLDQDGLLDLVLAMSEMPDVVLRQKPDGSFQPMNQAWGVPSLQDRGWGVLAADFDNDGDADLYFPTGGFYGAQTNTFLRNDIESAGKLVDITASSGDAGTVLDSNFGGTVLDYDHDGDLDIFLSSASSPSGANPRCTLLRNDGNLIFTDVSIAADIREPGDYRHCSSGDIDNDGWVDVVVGNYDGDNRLYHNNGDGTFTDIAVAAGVADGGHNFGFILEDFDNDGWLDAYIPKYQFVSLVPSGLLLNNHDGTFRDVRLAAGMTVQGDMGHNTADLNADSFPDIFIGTGHPNYKRDNKVLFVRPDPARGLVVLNLAGPAGFLENGPTRTHGIAFGDIDNDGDLDVYTNNGGPGFLQSTRETNALWMAQGNANDWAKVHLVGVKSNKDAVGARVSIVDGAGRTTWRTRTIGKGFCNTDAPELFFGLGNSTSPLRLHIDWPSGLTQDHLSFPGQKGSRLSETAISTVGTPTVGGNITVNVYGPANGTVTLFHGTAPGEELDWNLGGIFHMAAPRSYGNTYSIGANGKVNVTFAVPNDPGLAGNDLFLQAQIEDPFGGQPTTLTNLVTLHVQ